MNKNIELDMKKDCIEYAKIVIGVIFIIALIFNTDTLEKWYYISGILMLIATCIAGYYAYNAFREQKRANDLKEKELKDRERQTFELIINQAYLLYKRLDSIFIEMSNYYFHTSLHNEDVLDNFDTIKDKILNYLNLENTTPEQKKSLICKDLYDTYEISEQRKKFVEELIKKIIIKKVIFNKSESDVFLYKIQEQIKLITLCLDERKPFEGTDGYRFSDLTEEFVYTPIWNAKYECFPTPKEIEKYIFLSDYIYSQNNCFINLLDLAEILAVYKDLVEIRNQELTKDLSLTVKSINNTAIFNTFHKVYSQTIFCCKILLLSYKEKYGKDYKVLQNLEVDIDFTDEENIKRIFIPLLTLEEKMKGIPPETIEEVKDSEIFKIITGKLADKQK
jgi:hypothetical protein